MPSGNTRLDMSGLDTYIMGNSFTLKTDSWTNYWQDDNKTNRLIDWTKTIEFQATNIAKTYTNEHKRRKTNQQIWTKQKFETQTIKRFKLNQHWEIL